MDDHSSNTAGANPEEPDAGGEFGQGGDETLTATELRLRAVASAAPLLRRRPRHQRLQGAPR
ncbi:MAG: hypothetical protein WDN04_01915 [Rhodospirillales bacterium]